MGYILVLVLGVVLVGVLIVVFSKQSSGSSEGKLPSDRPVAVTEPAADEPNPAASDTASQSKANAAQTQVPPA